MDLIGAGSSHSFPGVSLLRNAGDSVPDTERTILAEAKPAPWHEGIDEFPVSHGPMFSLHERQWHYLIDGNDVESLFDLSADPWELSDLSHDSTMAGRLARFRLELQGSNALASPPKDPPR
jgi:hypothetical protein